MVVAGEGKGPDKSGVEDYRTELEKHRWMMMMTM